MAKAAAPQEMQLAEILSDLVSLRPGVCVGSRFSISRLFLQKHIMLHAQYLT
jgi:hypothetical protein